MANWITTYTGLRFDPLHPEPDKIRIEDIAHALSLLCRGNGHVRQFYSVGQHCIACAKEAEARGCSARLILACLLHDAGEAYLLDLPSPVKRQLPAYSDCEDRLLSVIYQRFLGADLTQTEADFVKEIDRALLYYDLRDLLSDAPSIPPPVLKHPLARRLESFSAVEEEYLALFRMFSRQ